MVPHSRFRNRSILPTVYLKGMRRNVTVVTGEGNEEHFGEAGAGLILSRAAAP